MSHKSKAYLKSSCPFSFKFLLFITEAGLLDEVEVIRVDADDDQALDRYRAELEQVTGAKASFPTVEVAPGVYESDSDGLIALFAQRHDIDVGELPTLAFFKSGLFPTSIARFKEIRALKEQLGGLSA